MTALCGFDKLRQSITSAVDIMIKSSEDNDYLNLGSPIERLFHHAFMFKISGLFSDHYVLQTVIRMPWSAPEESRILYYHIQSVVFDNWPIDFIVSYKFLDRIIKIAIECDGHDFHERTKEQAARDRRRDRKLQGIGFTILRFTGSEIYADPFKCAGELLETLEEAQVQIALADYEAQK